MTTIKERFEEIFVKDVIRLRMVGQQTGYVFPDEVEVTDTLLAFIKQELELLSEEVEAGVSKNVHSEYRQALVDVVELIRGKSKELE